MSPSQRNCYKNVKVRTVVWLVYLFLTTSPIGAVWERNHYYRLEEDLLTNYSPTVRPVLDVNTVTNVSISFLVLCVYEVSASVSHYKTLGGCVSIDIAHTRNLVVHVTHSSRF